MDFLGFDKSRDMTELQGALAQEAVNCFPHGGKFGTLGARKGRAWESTSAYAATVYGAIPFELPSGDVKWIVAHGTSAVQENAPFSTKQTESFFASDEPQFRIAQFPSTTMSVSFPSWEQETTVDLQETIPAGTYEVFVPDTYAWSVTAVGGTQQFNTDINIYFVAADDSAYGMLIEDYDHLAGSLERPATDGVYHKASVSIWQDATKVKFRLVTTGGSGVTDYSGTCGPFSWVLLRG